MPKKPDTDTNPLSEDIQADGAASAETGPPDSYLTTDGSATTATADVGERPAEGDAMAQALTEQQEKYLRLAAEYENFRKRTRKERDETWARAQGELAKHLLDPLDDLSRFAHVDPASADPATILRGAELVERKLLKSLMAAGLEILNPVGERFNPELHEAVATEAASTPQEDHTVARVYQQGYVFAGQLLRPARVVVKQLV